MNTGFGIKAIQAKLGNVQTELRSLDPSTIVKVERVDVVPQPSRSRHQREYFPVTQRQMKQNWRRFRRQVRRGAPTELDVSGTIDRICREGILLAPVLRSRRVNAAQLLLLIDCEGSMVAFHKLGDRLVETARRGGNLGQFAVRYFKNCPTQTVYRDFYRIEGEDLSQVLDGFDLQVAVLIFSDGGAARGAYNGDRLEETDHFLEGLRDRVGRVVWLNPLPQHRWEKTTARAIADRVPMVELSYSGLQQAVDRLRGRR